MPRKFLFLAIALIFLPACSAEQNTLQSEPEAGGTAELADASPVMATLPPTQPPTAAPPAASTTATPLLAAQAVVESTATAAPPMLTPLPSATTAPEPAPVISGQTADGAFFLGAPDAPLTLIDYSDFL